MAGTADDSVGFGQPLGGGRRAHFVDESGHVARDVPCRKCGYNLRGLAETGACPECATAASVSLSPDLLVFANPDWLRRVAVGCSCIVFAVSSLVGLVALLMYAGPVLFATLGVWVDLPWRAFLAVIWGITCAGCWLITSPNRGVYSVGRTSSSAVIARRMLWFASSIIVVRSLLAWGMRITMPLWFDAAIGFLAYGSGFVCLSALLMYESDIARRAPDESLRNSLRVSSWVVVAAFLLRSTQGLADLLLSASARLASNQLLEGMQNFVRIIAGLLILYTVVRTIELHLRLAHLVREREKTARVNWQR